jgi:hypothetical protein
MSVSRLFSGTTNKYQTLGFNQDAAFPEFSSAAFPLAEAAAGSDQAHDTQVQSPEWK